MAERRVMLVEDDAQVRRVLEIALRDEGFRVRVAGTGEDALDALTEHPVDVVVLDLMLPGIDGFEVCRRLRRTSDVPVIVVSARTNSHDIVGGLEAGADDYVTKPVVAKELAARIRAVLRRARLEPSAGDTGTSVVGDIEIRPQEATVLKDGVVLALTATEFRLLQELATRIGEVITRESLLERIWSLDYFGDSRIVDVHISRLRAKIESDPAHPRHVITVRGIGYKLSP